MEQETISFRKGFGYKCIDVDTFVDETTAAITALQSNNRILQIELENKTEKVRELGKALKVLYQEVQDLREAEFERARKLVDILEAANKTAECILAESVKKAKETEAAILEMARKKAAEELGYKA